MVAAPIRLPNKYVKLVLIERQIGRCMMTITNLKTNELILNTNSSVLFHRVVLANAQ